LARASICLLALLACHPAQVRVFSLPKLQPSRHFQRSLLRTSGLVLLEHLAAAHPLHASAAASAIFRGEIRRSPTDQRQYCALSLANGLRVLLVSDATATASAAALSVHAGFYLDPPDLPGLAHLCEHMLFLGTEDYPEENSFRLFLSDKGGSLNAFTREQETTYYFDVSPASLVESLRRFGSFFTSPLFAESSLDREVQAIEAEDAKNRQSDSFRFNQLVKLFATEGHPQRKFGAGNLRTLAEPARDGRARTALLEYFQQYYDAGLMALCVLGRESLGDLKKVVEQSFGRIRGAGLRASPFLPWRGVEPFPPPVRPGSEAVWVEVVPVAERRSISVSWPFLFRNEDEKQAWIHCKPFAVLSFLLGHEGPSSLLSRWRRRGWATGVLAGAVREDDNFVLLKVGVDVTQEGLSRRDDIIEGVYGVLRQLERDGIPAYLLDESSTMAEIRFRFQAKPAAATSAITFVEAIQRGYGPANYVCGPALPLPLPGAPPLSQQLAAVISQMRPEHASQYATSKDFKAKATASEQWYGTSYGFAAVEDGTLSRWRDPGVVPGYAVPPPNRYIPRDFSPRNAQVPAAERAEAIAEPPRVLQDDERWQIFYKGDRCFGIPKAVVLIFLGMPDDTVEEDAVPSRLWLLALTDYLSEMFYDASYAGFQFQVSNEIDGLSIQFAGFSDKLVLLVEKVLAALSDFQGPSDEDFAEVLDRTRREQKSFDAQPPYQYASYTARIATHYPDYSIEFLRKQTDKASAGAARAFGARLRGRTPFYGQALLQGNLAPADAAEIQRVLNTMPFEPLPRAQRTRVAVVKPPINGALVMRSNPNAAETNRALWITFSTGPEAKVVLLTELLHSILADPFYNELRTKQQLGYVVLAQADRDGLAARLSLAVQSSNQEPGKLWEAMQTFLAQFKRTLEELPAKELSAFKIELVEQIVKPDERLGEEAIRWWEEIRSLQFSWRRRSEEANLVTSITKADLVSFYESHFLPGGAEYRPVVSAAFAAGAGRDAAERALAAKFTAQGGVVIQDSEQFSKMSPKWPVAERSPYESL
ncbi:IDE, partial [Symbiodinium natans]